MSDEEYVPLVDRNRQPTSRVHEDLTQTARERLSVITEDINDSSKQSSLDFLMSKVGRSPVLHNVVREDEPVELDSQTVHRRFVENGQTVHVLTYLEDLVKRHHLGEIRAKNMGLAINRKDSLEVSTETEPLERTPKIIGDIREILITEGILWRVESAGSGGVIQFVPMESQAFKDIDDKIRALGNEGRWAAPLEGYDDAFGRYLNGDFDDTLVKKLYNSIEEVLKTICVDLEGWTEDRERGHGYYLELLADHEVYNANGITAPELNVLLDVLEKMVSKVGHDRKQRHTYHDRAYATLLIHQVGAFLYFVISRYEESKG